jgi:hypothetical protein
VMHSATHPRGQARALSLLTARSSSTAVHQHCEGDPDPRADPGLAAKPAFQGVPQSRQLVRNCHIPGKIALETVVKGWQCAASLVTTSRRGTADDGDPRNAT